MDLRALELEAGNIPPPIDKSIEGIADFQKDYIQLSPDATIDQSERMDINGHPAYKIVYSQHVPNSADIWKIMEVYILAGNTQYTILFTATDSEHYYGYLSIVGSIIQSMKVEEKQC
jgi:PsbP-like protein